jgi:hypothetical protein
MTPCALHYSRSFIVRILVQLFQRHQSHCSVHVLVWHTDLHRFRVRLSGTTSVVSLITEDTSSVHPDTEGHLAVHSSYPEPPPG